MHACTTVGGNHEAANHLWELYYGGWAAPDIYFLGFTGAVKFAGLRIAGLSGIYKQVAVTSTSAHEWGSADHEYAWLLYGWLLAARLHAGAPRAAPL
jgi:hypothetical protein